MIGEIIYAEKDQVSAEPLKLTERAAELSDVNGAVRDRADILPGDIGQAYAQLSLQQDHP